MDTSYYYFRKSWVEFSTVGISTLFVAASLDRIKIIYFLGQNKNLILKAQLLLYFFSILIIVLMITKLDLLHSLSRWN